MSQPDLLTQLREARPVAPTELRERVRLVADRAPQTRRRLTWRLGAVLAFAAALAIVAAVVATRGDDDSPTAVSGASETELAPAADLPPGAAPDAARTHALEK